MLCGKYLDHRRIPRIPPRIGYEYLCFMIGSIDSARHASEGGASALGETPRDNDQKASAEGADGTNLTGNATILNLACRRGLWNSATNPDGLATVKGKSFDGSA